MAPRSRKVPDLRNPEKTGVYIAFYRAGSGEILKKRIWFWNGETTYMQCFCDPQLGLPVRVAGPLPGTTPEEWPRPIDEDGAVNLMAAILECAIKDAKIKNLSTAGLLNKDTAVDFLSRTDIGRRALREIEERAGRA